MSKRWQGQPWTVERVEHQPAEAANRIAQLEAQQADTVRVPFKMVEAMIDAENRYRAQPLNKPLSSADVVGTRGEIVDFVRSDYLRQKGG